MEQLDYVCVVPVGGVAEGEDMQLAVEQRLREFRKSGDSNFYVSLLPGVSPADSMNPFVGFYSYPSLAMYGNGYPQGDLLAMVKGVVAPEQGSLCGAPRPLVEALWRRKRKPEVVVSGSKWPLLSHHMHHHEARPLPGGGGLLCRAMRRASRAALIPFELVCRHARQKCFVMVVCMAGGCCLCAGVRVVLQRCYMPGTGGRVATLSEEAAGTTSPISHCLCVSPCVGKSMRRFVRIDGEVFLCVFFERDSSTKERRVI